METTLQIVALKNYYDVYPASAGHRVAGDVRVLTDVYSPQLQNERNVLIYLPPSYVKGDDHYPVLYMHDGQNLYDPATSFAGEWGVDEAMEQLAREEGLEAIVIAIPNMGSDRIDEYSPFADPAQGGGKGHLYVAFIVNTLKPLIDAHLRTLPHRRTTCVMGSSMGGLISLYAFFRREDIFGFAGVMSPSLWFARGAIYHYVENASYLPGRIYLDAGTRELGGSRFALLKRARSRSYYASVRRLKRILVQKGYRPRRDLMHVEEKWATHSEAAWARRVPCAIRFFLTGSMEPRRSE